jgi:capsid protein
MSQSAAKTSSPAVRRAPRISADYESARSTADNLNLWANADALSADAAISVGVRRRLRNRSRHEVANNSYLKGAQLTIANDTIGVGPSLQMNVKAGDGVTEAEDAGRPQLVPRGRIRRWAREIRQAEKLRTCRASRFESGESS